MTVIKTEGLTKSYDHRKVVNDVSFTVEEGELIALLGVNGAGKSTIIRMLTGLARPDSGSVEIYGHNTEQESAEIKQLIGVSPQETATAPNLSVYENLELTASLHGLRGSALSQKVNGLMATFGLDKVKKQKSKTLSGGWRRRLSIAMAMVSDPKILFLYEPTLGLDVLARRELWNLIRGLKGKATVILTTHYLEEAEALADRILILREGVLTASGTAAELMEKSGCTTFEDAFISLAATGDMGGAMT